MPTFTAENRDMWNGLFASVDAKRPAVGKRVTVFKGKHTGLTGIVRWHGVDRYASTRYQSDAQMSLREAMGTFGYRVGIDPDGGGQRVFLSAQDVHVDGQDYSEATK